MDRSPEFLALEALFEGAVCKCREYINKHFGFIQVTLFNDCI